MTAEALRHTERRLEHPSKPRRARCAHPLAPPISEVRHRFRRSGCSSPAYIALPRRVSVESKEGPLRVGYSGQRSALCRRRLPAKPRPQPHTTVAIAAPSNGSSATTVEPFISSPSPGPSARAPQILRQIVVSRLRGPDDPLSGAAKFGIPPTGAKSIVILDEISPASVRPFAITLGSVEIHRIRAAHGHGHDDNQVSFRPSRASLRSTSAAGRRHCRGAYPRNVETGDAEIAGPSEPLHTGDRCGA